MVAVVCNENEITLSGSLFVQMMSKELFDRIFELGVNEDSSMPLELRVFVLEKILDTVLKATAFLSYGLGGSLGCSVEQKSLLITSSEEWGDALTELRSVFDSVRKS